MDAPPSHTPLAALPVLALDLETTGLDVRSARVVQFGAFAMRGSAVEGDNPLEGLVAPGVPIPAAATSVHGISDADVRDVPSIETILPVLSSALECRVALGHHVGFDLAVLAKEAARVGIYWKEPVFIDVALLAGALDPALPDVALETVAARFGFELEGRHSGLGDARAAAAGFSAMLPHLWDHGIRTLGEAQAFAAKRDDLVMRQAQSGWVVPVRATLVAVPSLRLDGYTFSRTLGDVMSIPAQFVPPTAVLRDAAARMVELGIGALLVGEPHVPPVGIVTERDLLRFATRSPAAFDATVTEAMSTPVTGMPAEAMIYRALGRMDRLGVRHLLVAGPDGVAQGMVSQRDLLHHRARAVGTLGDAIAAASSVASLAEAFGQLPRVAAGLLAEDFDGRGIARVVSAELRALTGRVAQLAAVELEAEGRGPAPAAWCVMVLGSGGRGESLLGADQDNALVHAGRPVDDSWFAALGERIAQRLHAVGVPRCKGGVMAGNAAWRGNDEEWRMRVQEWLRKGRPDDLLNVDIFFDLAPVAGTPGMAEVLRRDAVAAASRALPFLNLMAGAVQGLAPRLGVLGHLPVDDGRVDLKRDGLLPLVSFARTLALRVGSTALGTPDRLRDAVGAGRLPGGDAESLMELHARLLDAIVRQQLADAEEHRPPTSKVQLKALAREDRRHLMTGVRNLAAIVGEVRGTVSR